MRHRPAQALVFYTSGAVLVLEILAGRLMAPYVGVSLETFTGIIGVILAGIAIGSAVGGKLADRFDPRALLPPTVILGGALSMLSIPIVAALGPGVRGGGAMAIVFLTTFGFVAPATVLSAVSPMVAKLRVTDLDSSGEVIGNLSAAGTFGALAGTFTTGFVLVAAAPTRPIVLAVSLSLVLVGLWLAVAFRLGRGNEFVRGTTIAAVLAFVASVFIGSPCDVESAYACISIVDGTDPERPGERFLILDNARHAVTDIDDPLHLGFRYTRLFGDAFELLPEGPVDALHVGGGGFTAARYLAADRPGSTSLVLEIDGELVGVAEEHLGLVQSDDLRVEIGDARLAMPDLADDAYDLIIGDAYGGLTVPWHLTTTEFIAEIDRTLRPDGLYVMNMIDGGENRFARAQAVTLLEHFEHLVVIEPPNGIGSQPRNQLFIASDAPIATPVVDPEDGRVVTDLDTFIGEAEVLRDDFAPVDQIRAAT